MYLSIMIAKLIIQCLLGIAVGIYGYLIPGYINLSVLQLGLGKNVKAIRKTLIIISLIEIPYCFLCMSGMQWLMQQSIILIIIKWVLALMLFILAFFSFRDANKKQNEVQIKNEEMDQTQIKKLLFFAIFNPFQLSAWVIWGSYFIEKTWFSWTSFSILLFSLGASLGVLIILRIYAFAGQKLITYFAAHRKTIDYSVAGILLILAFVQLYRNLN
jgi:threonine/homoserine/homoserine lactone efflux protein